MEEIHRLDEQIKISNNELLVLTVGIEKQAGEINLIKERISGLKTQNEKIELDILNNQNSIIRYKAENEQKKNRKQQLLEQIKILEQSSGEYSKLLKEHSNLKLNVLNLTAQVKEEEKFI